MKILHFVVTFGLFMAGSCHENLHSRSFKWSEFIVDHGPMVPREYDTRNYFAVQLDSEQDVGKFIVSRTNEFENWRFEQPLGTLKDHYLFSVHKSQLINEYLHGINDKPQHVHDTEMSSLSTEKRDQKNLYRRTLQQTGVRSLQLLPEKQLYKRGYTDNAVIDPFESESFRRLQAPPVEIPDPNGPPTDSALQIVTQVMADLDINDPIFNAQWHLINPIQLGNDLNVTGVWYQNITGKGVAVAVVDDGLDMDHEDLKANYFAKGSYDFNDVSPEPRPRLSQDYHGTRCCGEIAAVRNDACGVGVAYDSNIAGIRILSKQISEADEAISLNYAFDLNDIYSCSWGPNDDGRTMAEPGLLIKKAFLNGVQNGRQQRGSVFVFASGNGARYGDNCNFDGYTNSIYSITVAAIDRKGQRPYYSEACAANLVVSYSSGSGDSIHTTDLHGKCTSSHGGTSAAAPIAAGVFALVLSIRPELTWRDLQYLALDSAIPVNEKDGSWQDTFIGKKFSHNFGYGKLDAYGIVERAKTWELVKPQSWFFSDREIVSKAIPAVTDDSGLISTIYVSDNDITDANLERLEHVNVVMNLDHNYRGSLQVDLISPSGVVSTLAANRPFDDSIDGYKEWTFMSVAHWGESGVGNWTIKVRNNLKNKEDKAGVFRDWTLKLWGEAKDASKAKLFSFDEANKEIEPELGVSTAPATPISTTSSTTSTVEKPSTPATSSSTTPPTSTSSSSRPWSLIPTFGLSTRTLVWLYGSILLIVLFIAGIALYFFISRRNRSRRLFKRNSSLPSYEFDLLAHGEDDDDEDDDSGIFSPDIMESDAEYTDAEPLKEEQLATEPRLMPGKNVRNLYDKYAQKKENENNRNEIFKVDSGDEETQEASTSSGSSTDDNETLGEHKESQPFLD